MSSNLVFILRQVSFDPLDDFLTLFLSTVDDFIFESLKLLSSLSVRVVCQRGHVAVVGVDELVHVAT